MKKLMKYTVRYIPRKHLHTITPFVTPITSLIFSGSKYHCPVCDSNFRKLLPYGVKSRENALCPSCFSLERHRLMWLYLKNKTDFFTKKAKMLHVAPEQTFLKRFEKLPNLDYITADLESPWAKVKMDIHDIPFEDNTFDVIFCNHVLEHVEDDIQCMRELRRVLKPNGWALLQSPMDFNLKETIEDPSVTDPNERERLFGQKDHLRMYGLDYGKRLESAGFKVKPSKLIEELSETEVKKFCLMEKEYLYICYK